MHPEQNYDARAKWTTYWDPFPPHLSRRRRARGNKPSKQKRDGFSQEAARRSEFYQVVEIALSLRQLRSWSLRPALLRSLAENAN